MAPATTATTDPRPTTASGALDAAAEHYGRPARTLRGYAGIMAAYSVLVGGTAAVLHRRALLPDRTQAGDLVLAAIATHKLSRTLAKDSVTSPLRAPFARFEGPAGPGEVNERVAATGRAKALGELLTCPFCLDQWVATGFLAGMAFAPRVTRFVAGTFAARAGADFLQLLYASAERAAEG